jgi:polyketide biosynthesis acyl carrier protein
MSNPSVFETFTSVFADVVPDVDVRGISPADKLRELGANSIDRAEIITETMQKLGVSVPMVTFASAETVGDVVAILSDQGARV